MGQKNFRSAIKSTWALALSCFLPWLSPAAHAQVLHDCGKGVSVHLSAPAVAQGGLLEVTLRSPHPLSGVKTEWAGHDLPSWTDAAHESIRHAILGVDVEKPPGQYELKISMESAQGESATCTVTVPVRSGKFIVERLHVAQKFVELNDQDAQRAIAETKRLREILATVTPERLWQGNFKLPLVGITKGSNFGTRRILNGEPRSPHAGVDFPAGKGTPVHASQKGRVVLAEPLFFSGNTLIIDHGFGIYTLYGHLDSFAVGNGDTVEAGQVIGRVGATGRVTGPHLHWGLEIEGARVNALQIVGVGGN